MVLNAARQRSLYVYHLHMGGPDAVAVEWSALLAPRFEARVRHLGVMHVYSAAQADVVVVSGLLTPSNLDGVLTELATMPSPAVLIAAGDSVINPAAWSPLFISASTIQNPKSKIQNPKLTQLLSHYADIHISVPGNPPTPQALIAAIAAAANLISQPGERLQRWSDQL